MLIIKYVTFFYFWLSPQGFEQKSFNQNNYGISSVNYKKYKLNFSILYSTKQNTIREYIPEFFFISAIFSSEMLVDWL